MWQFLQLVILIICLLVQQFVDDGNQHDVWVWSRHITFEILAEESADWTGFNAVTLLSVLAG